MLKPYKIKTYISINNEPKIKISHIDYRLLEDDLPEVKTYTYTFQDALTQDLPTSAVRVNETLFRHRPYVEVNYDWDCDKRYYNFDMMTIERHKEPWNASLANIMQVSTADDFIQYLKERGITTCPMNF